jgi:hypothetical protein
MSNRSEKAKLKWADPAFRARMSAIHKARYVADPTVTERMSEYMKLVWADPDAPIRSRRVSKKKTMNWATAYPVVPIEEKKFYTKLRREGYSVEEALTMIGLPICIR